MEWWRRILLVAALVVFHVSAAASGGGASVGTGSAPPIVCKCTKELIYQCGSDGKTYDNPCLAKCAGVEYKPGKCSETAPNGPDPAGCACTMEWFPVCGSDGKTYSSPSCAKCAQVDYTQGACSDDNSTVAPDDPCGCGFTDTDAVCGADNITYANECQAKCNKVTSVTAGACLFTVVEPPVVEPPVTVVEPPVPVPAETCDCTVSSDDTAVCDQNGKRYPNKCVALCANATDFNTCPIVVVVSCKCNRIYLPVCGIDNVTYPNACLANCTNIAFVDGACASDPSTEDGSGEGGNDPCVANCPQDEEYVCGSNGVTYLNKCFAVCDKVKTYQTGACDPPMCACTMDYRPVCDPTTNITYGNACSAKCSNVTAVVDGTCDGTDVPVSPTDNGNSGGAGGAGNGKPHPIGLTGGSTPTAKKATALPKATDKKKATSTAKAVSKPTKTKHETPTSKLSKAPTKLPTKTPTKVRTNTPTKKPTKSAKPSASKAPTRITRRPSATKRP